jgi:hypothetical protein
MVALEGESLLRSLCPLGLPLPDRLLEDLEFPLQHVPLLAQLGLLCLQDGDLLVDRELACFFPVLQRRRKRLAFRD